MPFGGNYELLTAERGHLGMKVGGRLGVALPCETPLCKQCGHPMEFLMQFPWQRQDPAVFQAAMVFMCRGSADSVIPCETASASLGANAVILLRDMKSIEPSGLSSYPAFRVKWTQCQEPFQDTWASDLGDSDIATAGRDKDAFLNKFGWTKLGGQPLWMSNPETPVCPACGGPTIFAVQFDSALGFTAAGGRVMLKFGNAGVGYLFLCAHQCSERGGAFLWQSA